MTRRPRRWRLAVPLAIAAVLAVAGCSGTSSPAPTASSPSSSSSSSSSQGASASGTSTATGSATPSDVVWLCRPGRTPDPCEPGLRTTTYSPTLRKTSTSTPATANTTGERPACFYVYPTVSEQTSTYSDRTVEAAEEQAARVQAGRWSQLCDVYAPMYRQLTLPALDRVGETSLDDPSTLFAPGIADVTSAFRQFLATTGDRPFVVLAHSQGSFIMRSVLAKLVDDDATVRARMLSAIIPGSNVLVRSGTESGGDFDNLPGCTKQSQTGCVIAYSTFGYIPDSTIWGVTDESGMSVLCTNPTRIDGTRTASPIYAAGQLSSLPTTSSTWVSVPGEFTASCHDDPSVLLLHARKGSTVPSPTSVQSWGLHDLDANMFLGNLLRIVRAQEKAHAG